MAAKLRQRQALPLVRPRRPNRVPGRQHALLVGQTVDLPDYEWPA